MLAIAGTVIRSKPGQHGLMVLPNRPQPTLEVVPAEKQMLVTSYNVSAQSASLTGKVISYLINNPSSPLHTLADGMVVHNEENGCISFYLTKIPPEDLRDIRHLIDQMPRPFSISDHISEQAWKACRREVAARLNPHRE